MISKLKQIYFVHRLKMLRKFYKIALFIPKHRYNYLCGYYYYENIYENPDYPITSGYVKIIQYRGHVSLDDGFSDNVSHENQNPVARWYSTFAELRANNCLYYEYTIERFRNRIYIDTINAKAHLSVVCDRQGIPVQLEEVFENPVKGKGKCTYKQVSKSRYYKAKCLVDKYVGEIR